MKPTYLFILSAAALAATCGPQQSKKAENGNSQSAAATFEASTNRQPAAEGGRTDGQNGSRETFRIDSAVTLRGRVVVAHEVRSFTPAGDSTEYWLIDPSGDLEREYARASGGSTSGAPVDAELTLRYKGTSDEGFAAEYEGVFEVEAIRSMKPVGE